MHSEWPVSPSVSNRSMRDPMSCQRICIIISCHKTSKKASQVGYLVQVGFPLEYTGMQQFSFKIGNAILHCDVSLPRLIFMSLRPCLSLTLHAAAQPHTNGQTFLVPLTVSEGQNHSHLHTHSNQQAARHNENKRVCKCALTK